MSQTDIAMKHRKIATSESSSKIINQHNQHVNVPNEHNNQTCIQDNDIKNSQCAISSQANKSTKRDGYLLIDQSNTTFASS